MVPIGSERSAAKRGELDGAAERVALGLLGDLVGHDERDLLAATGLVLQRGRLGTWLVGEQGAFLLRPGGRRIDCWCVRVADVTDLPAADRVAHLLLALREDELGFVKVANLGFSGARWRVGRHLDLRSRPALAAARAVLRDRCVEVVATSTSAGIICVMATEAQTKIPIGEEQLAAWRAFLRAHSTMLRRISRDLEDAGLPPLAWYDVLAALRDAPERSLKQVELAERVLLSNSGLEPADRPDREQGVGRAAQLPERSAQLSRCADR